MIPTDCDYRAIGRNAYKDWLDDRCETWLSESELQKCATLKDRSRREEWLLARRLAKELVFDRLDAKGRPATLRAIEIDSRDASNKGRRPLVSVQNHEIPWSLSICHSPTTVAVALCTTEGVSIGIDLTPPMTGSREIGELWFTDRELGWIQEQRPSARIALATVWAVKEAAYKALGGDEPFAPRRFEVVALSDGRFRCCVDGREIPSNHEIRTRRDACDILAFARLDQRTPVPERSRRGSLMSATAAMIS